MEKTEIIFDGIHLKVTCDEEAYHFHYDVRKQDCTWEDRLMSFCMRLHEEETEAWSRLQQREKPQVTEKKRRR